jgi:hypothetical protein
MKFAEIIEQVRDGKKARRKSWSNEYYWVDSALEELYADDIFADDWILEPEPIAIRSGGWGATEQPDYGLKISMDGKFLGNMTHELIDKLHAASLRIRGIAPMSAEEAWEKYNPSEQFNRVPMSHEFVWAFNAGQKSALSVVEYVEPDPDALNYWEDYYNLRDTTFFESARLIHKAGWTDHEAAMKGGQ